MIPVTPYKFLLGYLYPMEVSIAAPTNLFVFTHIIPAIVRDFQNH